MFQSVDLDKRRQGPHGRGKLRRKGEGGRIPLLGVAVFAGQAYL